MNELIVLWCLLCSTGYGLAYDGNQEGKHYFQVNTPKADYGLVLEKSNIYCDLVYNKIP
jgi:hypothetical protein